VTALLAACGGFLLAVLWMDLIFDVQVRGHASDSPLPEPVLASIATYYRRATTDSRPMSRLIAAVMLAAALGVTAQLFTRDGPIALRLAAFLACLAPVGLAGGRIVRHAVRLGARGDDALAQSALARGICRDHLLCFASIAAFTALELARQIWE
jgi:hypothetical protein